MPTSPKDVTQLLRAWRNGDETARDQVLPLVYEELRRRARWHMRRERPGHTLQTTALVHEAYCKLMDYQHIDWQDRAHFFTVAAGEMRRILKDYARRQRAEKRGGRVPKVSLDEVAVLAPERAAAVLALDEALTRLEALDPRKARIVEWRYFGGLSVEETAETLGVSPATVAREWRAARAWLYHALQGEADDA